jgi:DinB superfamily
LLRKFLRYLVNPNRRADIYAGMENLAEFNLDEAMAVLSRTPAALDTLLRGLPVIWVRSNEGKDTWNAFEIVGHLVYAERADWMPRVRILLESGESRPFDPFDRFAQIKESQGKSLEQLLDDFASVREENLTALQKLNLQPQDMARLGRHPALGSVKLSQLLATWAAHDLNHLHQLARVMAHQYRDAVGSWNKYLGVLQCNGHSAS